MRKTRQVKKDEYRLFLAKAEQFLTTMESTLQSEQWDSTGLQAVHAVISASDALIVYYGGIRSADPDHKVVIKLLQEIMGSDISAANRHVSQVIAKKNLVEYEQRRLTAAEAGDMAEHARRFIAWAKTMLPVIPGKLPITEI